MYTLFSLRCGVKVHFLYTFALSLQLIKYSISHNTTQLDVSKTGLSKEGRKKTTKDMSTGQYY